MSDLSHHDAMLDRIEELEAKLAKADALIGDLIECGPWYGETLIGFLARRAELTGGGDE